MKKILVVAMLTLGLLFSISGGVVFAADICSELTAETEEWRLAGCDISTTLPSVANNLIDVAIGVVGIVAVITIVYGGFTFVTSTGESNKAAKAKNIILYGVIGLVVALLAYAIVTFVSSSL